MKIPKTLKEALDMGQPELVADLIRQKLSLALLLLEEGADPYEVILQFQAQLGMDDFPAIPKRVA